MAWHVAAGVALNALAVGFSGIGRRSMSAAGRYLTSRAVWLGMRREDTALSHRYPFLCRTTAAATHKSHRSATQPKTDSRLSTCTPPHPPSATPNRMEYCRGCMRCTNARFARPLRLFPRWFPLSDRWRRLAYLAQPAIDRSTYPGMMTMSEFDRLASILPG